MIEKVNIKIEKVNIDVCTDIEQSERLLKLGISAETADMVILDRVLNANDVNIMHKSDICKDLYGDEEQQRIIPAWSIDALYKLVKTLLEEKALRDSHLGLAENKCD